MNKVPELRLITTNITDLAFLFFKHSVSMNEQYEFLKTLVRSSPFLSSLKLTTSTFLLNINEIFSDDEELRERAK